MSTTTNDQEPTSWQVQRERSEHLLYVCERVREGSVGPQVGLAALIIAGVDECSAGVAISEVVRDRQLPDGMRWDGDSVVMALGDRVEPNGTGGVIFRRSDGKVTARIGNYAIEAAMMVITRWLMSDQSSSEGE